MVLDNVEMYFTPIRDQDGRAVLAPVLVSDDGSIRLTASKVVTDVEKALSMYSGFTLAAAIDLHGGLEGLKEAVESKEEDDSDA